MKKCPDFFVSAAGEVTGDLATPRACWTKSRLRDETRDDHMLVEVAPPVIGQRYGLGDRDIANLIITARYKDSTLFPVTEWPCHVYITRILDQSLIKALAFTKNQVEMIAWGMIFPNVEEANGQGKESPHHAS